MTAYRGEQGDGERVERKTWRVVAPKGDYDPTHRTLAELAFTSLVHSYGWEIEEFEEPKETDLTEAEIVAVSERLYGDARPGEFANKFLEWLAYGASADISEDQHYQCYLAFYHSMFWLKADSFEGRIDVKKLASESKLEEATLDLLAKHDLPFRYTLHWYPRFKYQGRIPSGEQGYLKARAMPESVTREGLQRFLTKPRSDGMTYADHAYRGLIGRAFETLYVASGLVGEDDIDPARTAYDDELFISIEELTEFAARAGVTKSMIRSLLDRISNMAHWQLSGNKKQPWGEVILPPEATLVEDRQPGFRSIAIPRIAYATLGQVRGAYDKLDPRMAEVLEVFEAHEP